MSYVGLPSFCERVSRESGADAPECYLRLRVGENRRTAQLAASRIGASGRDPVELAAELESRIDNLGPEAIWIEAMHKGLTNPIDSFRIPKQDGDKPESGPMGVALQVIERMARSADERASGAEFRCQQSHERMFDMMELVWGERLKFRELELKGQGGFGEALQMAGPALALLTSRILAKPSPSVDDPAQPPIVDDAQEESEAQISEEAVDQCIAYLAEVTAANPALITPERIEAMTPIVERALGL